MNNDYLGNFRYNLRLLRSSHELSGEALASRIGLSPKRINDLEGARMPPTMEDLAAIKAHFNVTFDQLLQSKIKLSL